MRVVLGGEEKGGLRPRCKTNKQASKQANKQTNKWLKNRGLGGWGDGSSAKWTCFSRGSSPYTGWYQTTCNFRSNWVLFWPLWICDTHMCAQTHIHTQTHTHTDTHSKKTISEAGKTWSLRMLVTFPQDPGSISQNSHGSSHLCNPSSRESDSF